MILAASACSSSRPNFILVIIDATSADHLGCYGYSRNTSPALDSLADSGILWTRCQGQAPWTLPACASIHTGVSVTTHGVMQDLNGTFGIPPDLPVAAAIFADGGYATAAVVNSYWTGPDFNFHHGFRSFAFHSNGNSMARESVEELIPMIEEGSQSQNSFSVLHLYDPHSPYFAPEGYDNLYCVDSFRGEGLWSTDINTMTVNNPEDATRLMNLYDGEISWVDSQLAILFRWLRETGRAHNTVVIVTADHGEEFLDHGWVEHSTTLYQELLHVPLIISGPGIPAGVRSTVPAAQIDILPTMLSLAGIEIPEHLEGIDLFSDEASSARFIPSSGTTVDHGNPAGPVNRNWIAIREGDTKLIWKINEGTAVTYDLAVDPFEQNPLPADSLLMERAMDHLAAVREYTPFPVGDPGAERVEELRGLGYI